MSTTLLPFPFALDDVDTDARLRRVIDEHYAALWRFLRRLGVEEGAVEDAVQQVLLVFARRAGGVEPAATRAFLIGTAMRVAADHRRRERHGAARVDPEALGAHPCPSPDAEQQAAQRQLRGLLERALDALSPELRAVFVLAELEELTMAEVARLLEIPAGTVASRLRRARELFADQAETLRAFAEKGAR